MMELSDLLPRRITLECTADGFLVALKRLAQITAVHALDRALLSGHYIITHWYSATHRVAWRDRFAMPKVMPRCYQAGDWMLATWWVK
jgi:microcin C transport system substrate-binding protein